MSCVWVIGASSINTSNESSKPSSLYMRSLKSKENDLEENEKLFEVEKPKLRKRRKSATLQTDEIKDDSQEETRIRKKRKDRNRESLIEQDTMIQSDPESVHPFSSILYRLLIRIAKKKWTRLQQLVLMLKKY